MIKPLLALAMLCFSSAGLLAQNLVENRGPTRTLPPISITLEQAADCIAKTARFGGEVESPEAQRIQRKLNAHVTALLEGAPWMPFHHTLGISGYEASFDHSAEPFYALSIALPFLSPENAASAKRHLLEMLDQFPPYAVEGFDRRQGRARESYQVPDNLRLSGRSKAGSGFGVYAFWAFCHYAEAPASAKTHWPTVKARMEPLLQGDYRFDIRKTDYARDEAEKLNGDLAALIGFTRLARANEDHEAAERGLAAARRLLDLRVNLERVNPAILEKTTASKSLHLSKLARYCALTPETARAVREWSGEVAVERLQEFREARNGWHIAFGDRLIGGENYTNPLHFSRSLFAGAAFIEELDPKELLSLVDVPWCKADLHFIEKCSHALWAATGRPWAE